MEPNMELWAKANLIIAGAGVAAGFVLGVLITWIRSRAKARSLRRALAATIVQLDDHDPLNDRLVENSEVEAAVNRVLDGLADDYRTARRRGRHWEAAVDELSTAMAIIDDNNQVVRANRAFADVLDADVRTLEGTPLPDPVGAHAHRARDNQAVVCGLVECNGELRKLRATPLPQEYGEPWVCAVFDDEAAAPAAPAAPVPWRQNIEALPMPAVLADFESGQLLFTNAAFSAQFGFDAGLVAGGLEQLSWDGGDVLRAIPNDPGLLGTTFQLRAADDTPIFARVHGSLHAGEQARPTLMLLFDVVLVQRASEPDTEAFAA